MAHEKKRLYHHDAICFIVETVKKLLDSINVLYESFKKVGILLSSYISIVVPACATHTLLPLIAQAVLPGSCEQIATTTERTQLTLLAENRTACNSSKLGPELVCFSSAPNFA
jgi:hypothetical protein